MFIILLGRSDKKLLEVVLALLGIRGLDIGCLAIRDPACFKKFFIFFGSPFIFFKNLNFLKRLGFKA